MINEVVRCPLCGEQELFFENYAYSWGVVYSLRRWNCLCHEEGCTSETRMHCCETVDLSLFNEGIVDYAEIDT